ncbi:MAG: transglycosylase domain-containing protein [Spirochaetaceae bacterium]|nr:transglycosylase domain-containing protein [Spirochaetaceae bacterium]
MARKNLRRALIIAGSLVFLYLASVRILPRLVPWGGEDTLDAMIWSHRILDREGRLIQVRPVNGEGLRRIFVPWDGIPEELLTIVRKSEDRRFYLHPGIDPPSLTRAGFRFARSGAPKGGGSTISMQLARIIDPRPPSAPVTIGMKAKEAWEALQIESRFTKREILELYINLVPFGRNVEGYPAAARLYFGRDLPELNPVEFCVLTVIPRAPGRFDPILFPEKNHEAAARLAVRVLGSDERAGFADSAHRRLLDTPYQWPFEAPHFSEYIMINRDDWPAGRRRGLEPIPTTLDLVIQRKAQRLLRHHVDIAGAFRISNGALILADPATMGILAYIGSADFRDTENDGQVDGIRMLREPGSTLKPLLYAEALEEGWTASTILPDIPTDFGGLFVYSPENYNEQYHGPIRLRQALAASLNVPAVFTLERLGVENFTETLIDAGFAGLEDQRGKLGVSLAIGGGEVSLAELVQAYGGLYNGGVVRPLSFISDEVGYGRQVWSSSSADIIADIISSVDDRVMTFGRSGPVRFDYPAAIKTGTSNQFNNIWALGFTSDLIGGVWMGNFDGTTVMGAPGSSLPAIVLHEAFDAWSAKGALPRHTELEIRRICSISGLGYTPHCTYTMDELFAPGTAPVPCNWHADAAGRARSVVRYPQEYSYWANRYGYDIDFSESAVLGIVHPAEGSVYYLDPGAPSGSQVIPVRLTGSGNATLSINGRILYEGSLPSEVLWPMEPGYTDIVLEHRGKRVIRSIEVR